MQADAAQEFDYVVVGGGTAGCALAARLSEDPQVRVVLLEAGPPDRHLFLQVPALVGAAISRPRLNWRFMTEPQAALEGRRVPIPRGRVLGGSGSINGMVYFRGHPADFDDWAAAGNPGWSYREVLPYFLRSERNPHYAGSPWHGQAGPMGVSFIPRVNPMTPAFLAAMQGLGFTPNDDFNAASPEGYGPRQGTIERGRRVSTSTAYLRPALGRPNLTLLTEARATQILLEGRRAVGVRIHAGHGVRVLRARAEVILTAGAIQSPQLLLLSGIGDPQHLESTGVTVRHALAGVGANYHDHPAVAVLMEMRNTASYGISLRATPRNLAALARYALLRSGPLASNVFEATGFVRTRPELPRPDVQVVFQAARRNRGAFPLPLGHGFAISLVGLYPRSRGSVRLASADPLAAPRIDPRLLSDPEDLATLLRGLELGRRIAHAPSFARYRAREVQPGPAARDTAALTAYIRRATITVHHCCGSCRMGSDAGAVVDPQLRVHGLEALRVADASVFPSVVGGNTNAAVVMIAEKCADMIRGRAPPASLDLPLARSA